MCVCVCVLICIYALCNSRINTGEWGGINFINCGTYEINPIVLILASAVDVNAV